MGQDLHRTPSWLHCKRPYGGIFAIFEPTMRWSFWRGKKTAFDVMCRTAQIFDWKWKHERNDETSSFAGLCRRRGRCCGLRYLTVIEGRILKISAPLKSLREKKKGFPQRHRERNNALKVLREVQIWTVGKNLNGERAENHDFQPVFLLARILL